MNTPDPLPDHPVFYATGGPDLTGLINLTDSEYRHAVSVLRLDTGDKILIADGNGRYYLCSIVKVGKKSISAQVNGMFHRDRDSEHDVVLACALIKNRQRLEWMLEKATELGASAIILFASERSERTQVRPDRLENILISALKQSKRYFLPRLTQFGSIDDIFQTNPGCQYIVAHEKESEGMPANEILQPGRKVLFIGPEGGFTDSEIDTLRQNQAVTIRLGMNRLRAETAAIALLSKFL